MKAHAMARGAVPLVVLTVLLHACGSGTDYYESLQAVSDDLEERYIALSLEGRAQLDSLPFEPIEGWHTDAARAAEQLLFEVGVPSQFDSGAVEIDLMMFRELQAILVEADTRMNDIKPDEELQAVHADIQAVCQEWAELLGRLIEELETAASASELVGELGTLDLGARFDDVHDRLDSNCVKLQAAAVSDTSPVRFGGAWVGGPKGEGTSVNLLCGG